MGLRLGLKFFFFTSLFLFWNVCVCVCGSFCCCSREDANAFIFGDNWKPLEGYWDVTVK